jgi:hypothetical protein
VVGLAVSQNCRLAFGCVGLGECSRDTPRRPTHLAYGHWPSFHFLFLLLFLALFTRVNRCFFSFKFPKRTRRTGLVHDLISTMLLHWGLNTVFAGMFNI